MIDMQGNILDESMYWVETQSAGNPLSGYSRIGILIRCPQSIASTLPDEFAANKTSELKNMASLMGILLPIPEYAL